MFVGQWRSTSACAVSRDPEDPPYSLQQKSSTCACAFTAADTLGLASRLSMSGFSKTGGKDAEGKGMDGMTKGDVLVWERGAKRELGEEAHFPCRACSLHTVVSSAAHPLCLYACRVLVRRNVGFLRAKHIRVTDLARRLRSMRLRAHMFPAAVIHCDVRTGMTTRWGDGTDAAIKADAFARTTYNAQDLAWRGPIGMLR